MEPNGCERALERLRRLRDVVDHVVRNADERPGRFGPAVHLRAVLSDVEADMVPLRDGLDQLAVLIRMEEAGHTKYLDLAHERLGLGGRTRRR